MKGKPIGILLLALAACRSSGPGSRALPIDSASLELRGLVSEDTNHDGRSAVTLSPADPTVDAEGLAILRGSDFANGTIEFDVAARPCEGIGPGARGFIGLAFHLQGDASKYECFYLRMTNARSDDQLRRNHSTQYVSHPDYPWERLRKETPGVYESYVDLVPGMWTRVCIVVEGTKARLYVGGSDQPCLIVNDLKLGETHGPIALWDGPFTIGCFSRLRITPS